MELRAYCDEDCMATRAVFERAVRLTASRDYTDEQIEAWAAAGGDDPDLSAWASARADARTVVAVEHGEILGFSDLVDGSLLDMLYVEPRAGGRGVATALLVEILRLAREGRADAIETDASITARPLFEHHGFLVVEQRSPSVRGITMTNFRMRRLPP